MGIELRRSDRYAIHLVFDKDGASELASAFRIAVDGELSVLPVKCNIQGLQRARPQAPVAATLQVEKSDVESMVTDKRSKVVRLCLDFDTLGYGLAKFEECQNIGKFEPAELCEVNTDRGRTDLYCIFSAD